MLVSSVKHLWLILRTILRKSVLFLLSVLLCVLVKRVDFSSPLLALAILVVVAVLLLLLLPVLVLVLLLPLIYCYYYCSTDTTAAVNALDTTTAVAAAAADTCTLLFFVAVVAAGLSAGIVRYRLLVRLSGVGGVPVPAGSVPRVQEASLEGESHLDPKHYTSINSRPLWSELYSRFLSLMMMSISNGHSIASGQRPI